MNKIKILLSLILCVAAPGVISNVSAQSGNKVLVSAGGASLKQSDVDRLIEFYEWAFQTEFTGEERAQFQQLKENEFRSNPAEAKKGNDNIGGYLPKVLAKSESEQARVREAFNADFIPHLREGANDAEAQLLIGIYDAAHKSDGTGGANDAADDGGDAVGGDISALVGKWVWSRTGGTTWNSYTGAYAGGNGSRFTYQFGAGGAVEYTGIMNVMMGGCSQQVFMSQKGRASLSGNQLTIRWAAGTSTRDFSCDKANNYTKTVAAKTETTPVSFKTNSTGQKLLCIGGGKDETCYSPSK